MAIGAAGEHYLPGRQARAGLMRLDTAALLKRFFVCEEALIRGQAGWLAAVVPFELKMALPRYVWEAAQTGDALRQRVHELRYPSRLMEAGGDAPLIALLEAARHAPSATAYLAGLTRVLVPALAQAYRAYLAVADELGDGPSRRFLEVALREKERQGGEMAVAVDAMLSSARETERAAARRWTASLAERLAALGGIGLEAPRGGGEAAPLPGSVPFALAEVPGRDPRFHRCRFYWPDNVDPAYGYGEGVALQLRSAVSHLNEVWAVETAGAILEAFAGPLGWEFVADAARWVYDESRHAQMGWTRLRDWGFSREELPLGTYIYDSARGQDPIYRLGMLFYFETKNIGKKPKRAEAFASYGDAASQHDMEFDWADESIHAGYGKRWLTALIAHRGLPSRAFDEVRTRCEELVAATVAAATPAEVAETRAVTGQLLRHARALVGSAAPAG
ncbi:MAG: hypothetical protein NVSMB65_04270 [Chloroflexota bacterium]